MFGSGDFSGNYSQTEQLGDQNGGIEYNDYQYDVIPERPQRSMLGAMFSVFSFSFILLICGLAMVVNPSQSPSESVNYGVSSPK